MLSISAASARPLPPLAKRCGGTVPAARLVAFRASDGTELDGAELGRGRVGVVLAHESPADLCSWLPYGAELAGNGFHVLVFDFRGFGFSANPRAISAQGRAWLDVVAAAHELRALGARRVFLVGASYGGVAVVVAAPLVRPPVAGVVSLSGETDLTPSLGRDSGMNARAAAPRLRVPLLVVGSLHDRYLPVADARRLVRAAGSRTKRLVLFPGTWHGWDLLYVAPYRKRVDALVRAFLRR